MRVKLLALLLGLAAGLIPASTMAAPGDDDRAFLLGVRTPVSAPNSGRVGNIVAIDTDAFVPGGSQGAVVRKNLVVIKGTAHVAGVVEGTITVIDGTLDLAPGARVNDINLVKSTFKRDPAAQVSGTIKEREKIAFSRGIGFVFGAVIWIGMTIAALAAGLLLAFFGGHQLKGAALALTDNPAASVIDAVLVIFALPVLAAVIAVTIVGLPLSLGIFFLLMPVVLILGYLITATRIGLLVTGAMGQPLPAHPYLAVFVGVLAFQLVAIVPGIGWVAVFLAMAWGAGGLLLYGWRAAHRRPETAPAV